MLPTPNSNLSAKLFPYWSAVAPWVSQPTAAAGAIVFPFWFFKQKTAQQLTGRMTNLSILEGVKGGVRAAPTLFWLIGSQMIAQRIIEQCLHQAWHKEVGKPTSFAATVAASAFVGALTVHFLAIFTGQTRTPKMNWKESIKAVTPRQALATAWMESCFILGVRSSEPLCRVIKSKLGEKGKKTSEYISSFVGGAAGALAGHPGDTALNLWLNKIPINDYRVLMRGAAMRCIGVGMFAVFFNEYQKFIENLHKNSAAGG